MVATENTGEANLAMTYQILGLTDDGQREVRRRRKVGDVWGTVEIYMIECRIERKRRKDL